MKYWEVRFFVNGDFTVPVTCQFKTRDKARICMKSMKRCKVVKVDGLYYVSEVIFSNGVISRLAKKRR